MEYVNQIRLEMQSCSENEALARTVAASFVAEMDPTMEELTEIRTAISEAVSNAVIHAYGGDRKGLIILEAALLSDGKGIFSVEDKGRGIEDIEKARQQRQAASQKERTDPTAEKESYTVDDKTLDEMMQEPNPQNITHKQPIDIEQSANPTKARTEKSNLSEPSFKMKDSTVEEKSEKPSVRKQIQEIKARRADETKKMPERSKSQEPKRHQNVKKKKSKGR